MKLLRDVAAPGARILFVGINPSLYSARVGHHFASPGNPFWRLLHAAGLVPVPLTAMEDARLAELGLGITNLVARPTRAASELTAAEHAAGRTTLERKVRRLAPRTLALVGITLVPRLFPGLRGKPGPLDARFAGVPVFVLPNTSGLNASYPGFAHKLVWFEALRAWSEAAGVAGPG